MSARHGARELVPTAASPGYAERQIASASFDELCWFPVVGSSLVAALVAVMHFVPLVIVPFAAMTLALPRVFEDRVRRSKLVRLTWMAVAVLTNLVVYAVSVAGDFQLMD